MRLFWNIIANKRYRLRIKLLLLLFGLKTSWNFRAGEIIQKSALSIGDMIRWECQQCSGHEGGDPLSQSRGVSHCHLCPPCQCLTWIITISSQPCLSIPSHLNQNCNPPNKKMLHRHHQFLQSNLGQAQYPLYGWGMWEGGRDICWETRSAASW